MVFGRIRTSFVAAALIAAFSAQSFFASLQKTTTFDEPAHIAAGLSYLQTGIFHLNLQQPPLLKELSAASLMLSGVRIPRTPEAMQAVQAPPNASGNEWNLGYEIIKPAPERVMFWARLPMILVGALLGVFLFLFGRRIVGEAAALGAVFLYALDPNVIAHSSLVTTDVGLAAFLLLFLFTLWRYLEEPGTARMIWCGIAMGLMLGAKYSGVFLLPVAAALAGVQCLHRTAAPVPAPSKSRKRSAHPPDHSPGKLTLDTLQLYRAAKALVGMGLIAWAVVWALFFFRSPFLYIEGMRRVNADHSAVFNAYMAGELAPRFTSYFAVCYLLKEPLAAILLAAAGLWLLTRSRTISLLGKLFLLLPPVVLFASYTWGADDIGFRYIIPILPFAWLLGGLALAALLGSAARGARIAGVAACAWLIVAAAGIYPDHLSYFNESACLPDSPSKIGWDGGSNCGTAWLADSNLDWGQGLKQLKSWLDAHAPNRPLYLATFSSIPAEYYGIRYKDPVLEEPPQPGIHALSATWVATLPALRDKLRMPMPYWVPLATPIAIVGHAFYIYDVPATGVQPAQPNASR
jgi:Dolichyl-phosphate-mannose-protein mannosyltransferase